MVHEQNDTQVSEGTELLMANSKKISKEQKNKLRNLKKKQRRKNKDKQKLEFFYGEQEVQPIIQENAVFENNEDVEIEYVERDEYLLTGQFYEQFKKVFQFFQQPAIEQNLTKKDEEEDEFAQFEQQPTQQQPYLGQQQTVQQNKPLSKKKRKQLQRLKVAQLKALVKRPDLVEAWDIASTDPLLLVFLKSYKNTVQVPQHWSQKRKFLQNKRGILKTPFQLPANVEATGIAKLRDPMDRDGAKMVRQKLRERMNPKLGKIDIDYEVLHDAFFKQQKKPDMTIHGDIYYEGKENEVKMKNYRPGRISDQLRQALGIAEYASPPWIINMQRYGPPPSYPNLKIPGLNTPLLDSYGHSMFGQRPDKALPFGQFGQMQEQDDDDPVDQQFWGTAQEQIIEEEEEEEDQEAFYDATESQATRSELNLDTRSVTGTLSSITGIETPEIEIRKNPVKSQPPIPAPVPPPSDKPLYQVLEPIQKTLGGGIMGNTTGYVIPEKEKDKKEKEKDKKEKDKDKKK